MTWDAQQYDAFAPHRRQAFLDLMAHVAAPDAQRVVDAGCGTGWTTNELARRFPGASVVGIDRSVEMLAQAAPIPRVVFEQADLASWTPGQPVHVVVSNAVLHWLGDQALAVERLASWLAPGGVLAFQVPVMQAAPSHSIIARAAQRPGVRDRLASLAPGGRVLPLASYAALLEGRGFEVDAWTTTYRMRLPRGGVLEWLKGTTLRPYIQALGDDAGPWVDGLAGDLEAAYPHDQHGVVFPFHRLFVVARAPR